MRGAGLAAVLTLAVGAGAGCGRDAPDGGGADRDGATTAPPATATQTVRRTTRVEVVEHGGAGQDFDAEAIYRRESPGVVTILAISSGAGSDDARGGLGSGFVLDGDGEIATNAHVVTTGEGKAIKQAREVFVRFGDGNQVAAKVVGFDPFSDVALLKVDPAGLTLRPVPLGAISAVHVGEPVAAIGSPFGEERSLSVGVISATDRSIESLTGFETSGALQTDAAINSGNSGGPLLDRRGRVVGINSQIRTESGEGSGVGFAVPVDVVRRSLDQLRRGGQARYAYLGVSTQGVYPQLADRFHLGTDHGAWIQTVAKGGPAAAADVRAGDDRASFQEAPYRVGGDVVTAVGATPIRRDADLALAIQDRAPGSTVTLGIVRDGRPQTIRVKLGTRPLQSPRG
ncbi:MAG TPA: trypsin-like peptidase domain-containing protein [Baekduia sp.]|jgi:S1-C subfamily serine protease